MTEQSIAVITDSLRQRSVASLELAFAHDPVMRWLWPDPLTYKSAFPRFVDAIAGASFTLEHAWSLHDCRAVALWLPPGVVADDDKMIAVILDSVDPALLEDLSGFGDQIHQHHPSEPHWYLPFVGVDPFLQGEGLGSSLMRQILARCDDAQMPAYLESSTRRSRALYESLGFASLANIQCGSSPTVCAMWRPAANSQD